MDLLHLICPASPSVWDGNILSECFSNMVLAFGGNVVTIFMIAMLGIANKSKQRTWRMNFFEKGVFYVLPIIGASLSFLDVAFLLNTAYHRGLVAYHSWLFKCSRFAVWALIILALKCPCGSSIFCNRVLCFWWAIKPLFMIPNLQATFRPLEVLVCLNESCMFLLDVMLGVSLNIIRAKRPSFKSRYYLDLCDFPVIFFCGLKLYWNSIIFASRATADLSSVQHGLSKFSVKL